ncbi:MULTISPECIES: DoxX family membrane protein [unclassified Prochlorococcus]|uniref:DoxX family membrane protein n=1 Tax=unclassified Prochlorococcus TaxID=2627481 RepID=UPI000690D9A1|nr:MULTISPECIES: DoxX family membrane protein [unclassified Prochlorococcus]
MTDRASRLFSFIGRAFLSTTFVVAIPNKISRYQYLLNDIVQKDIPSYFAHILLSLGIASLGIGSILLLSSKKQRLGSLILIVYLTLSIFTFYLYPFAPQRFFISIGLLGGLLLSLSMSLNQTKTIGSLSVEQFIQLAKLSIINLFR